jgi:hypothetical protein
MKIKDNSPRVRAFEKKLKRYKLYRTVTFLEFDEVTATSLADAKSMAFGKKSSPKKPDAWKQMGKAEPLT